ncbi:AMP deaminase, putative [Perkinsus marinus ATCC 50983]|uniref:AMP deaminase n=1 Tax=Perkinsus marinus (strain ATCC 50983 / TXsc) TaxID=423536 RepID=C5LTR4_PERM5|nr:AMP deaminase, putative [Perkinsus marinus ATCC 50983]EEQ99876.1 AMP deaminase, putative [Perkinsus marinus ATCC 50983]|eukprot:XP_002767159.1 AMP deaminase, putative [Perkinsus marinus ATCC 50983]
MILQVVEFCDASYPLPDLRCWSYVVEWQADTTFDIPSLTDYYDDMNTLFRIRTSGPTASFAFLRLRMLETKFELYGMTCSEQENVQCGAIPHRDFYNVRKVDTHIHHSAAMNAKHLLRFIKRKVANHADDEVLPGKTLGQVFDQLGVKPHDLSLDKLNVLADKSTLYRFDRFNAKYSPLGEPMLRTIFLKTDTFMVGRYLAELTKELLDDLKDNKYQNTEWRLSIYGRSKDEWLKLSRWVLNHGLIHENNRWMIQIPRLYSIYKKNGEIQNFQEFLSNIFEPLFAATFDPQGHPEVYKFMDQVSGFDTVDDESKSPMPNDRNFSSRQLTPDMWDLADNPSYKYYSYYIYANIRVLNMLREHRGLRPFDFRPHCGEAGEIHHLDTAFLLASNISHGINLRKSPVLQYLFYLAQIGIAVSPCSNNQLFLSYNKNPFPAFFARGLNVSLSSDDPLMFHQTREPLVEEYSIAKQVWRLNSVDMCEIARNSVLMSGFPDNDKIHWVGSLDRSKNEVEKTNVPSIRHKFRVRTYYEEWKIIQGERPKGDSLMGYAETQFLRSPSFRAPMVPHALPEEFPLNDLQMEGATGEEIASQEQVPDDGDIASVQYGNSTLHHQPSRQSLNLNLSPTSPSRSPRRSTLRASIVLP